MVADFYPCHFTPTLLARSAIDKRDWSGLVGARLLKIAYANLGMGFRVDHYAVLSIGRPRSEQRPAQSPTR